MRRRLVLGQALACALASPAGRAANAAPAPAPTLTQGPRLRVIVDNDFAGDPDGLFALAHQWLSPTARTVLVTSAALDPKLAALSGKAFGRTAALGSDRARQLAERLGGVADCPVHTGAESAGVGEAQITEAARAIVAQALRDDPLPLVLTCGGPLTNVAAALRLAPQIVPRLRVVWIGASLVPQAEDEYNLGRDIDAALQVLAQPGLAVTVVPLEQYRQLTVSTAELATDVRSLGEVGRWLHDLYLQLPPFVKLGAAVTLGDSALIDAALLRPEAPHREVDVRALLPARLHHRAGLAGRRVTLRDGLDARLLFADLRAKLRLAAAVPRTI